MVEIRIGSECTTEMQLRVTEVRETHLNVAKVNDFGVPVTRDKGNLIWMCYRLREFHYDLLVPAHPQNEEEDAAELATPLDFKQIPGGILQWKKTSQQGKI